MARRITDANRDAIEAAVRTRAPESVTFGEIAAAFGENVPRRTLQHRLRALVDAGRIQREGQGRWTRYRLADADSPSSDHDSDGDTGIALSAEGARIRRYIRQPTTRRRPVGYDRRFLDAYVPNVSSYLTETERRHLAGIGKPDSPAQPAGTYVRQILNRLLIDLSWNSSRLEGNTYSLLDTRRLVEFGDEAEGHGRQEAQMILNHKDAIEFLVSSADDIGFNRYTILNLHAILANNLLADTSAAGRLRHISIGIERSVFHPLDIPQLIEECFDQLLRLAARIEDPFEQAFFAMVQLPYLQPFDDVNKRVSRLAANIPLIHGNLSPLSFTDVSRATYTDAVLGVYELNNVTLLKELFIWAYERSAARYSAVRQSLGEPNPFRLQYREQIGKLVASIVGSAMSPGAASAHIAAWTEENIPPHDRERFRETVENELLSLHNGNFARYRIRPREFAAWKAVWSG